MMVLTDKPEVGQTDAALLVEELTGIYYTPTPKGWHRAKKLSNLYWLIGCPIQWRGVHIYIMD